MPDAKYTSGDLVRLVTDVSPQMVIGTVMQEATAEGNPTYMVLWFQADGKMQTAVLPEPCLTRSQ